MKKLFLFTIAIAASTGAVAGDRHSAAKNPNDMICRDQGVTGSRLDVKRVCMTRQQWEAQRRDAREAVERAQTQQNNPKG